MLTICSMGYGDFLICDSGSNQRVVILDSHDLYRIPLNYGFCFHWRGKVAVKSLLSRGSSGPRGYYVKYPDFSAAIWRPNRGLRSKRAPYASCSMYDEWQYALTVLELYLLCVRDYRRRIALFCNPSEKVCSC